jgi:hypothetical protein
VKVPNEFQVNRKQKEYEQFLRFKSVDGYVFIEKRGIIKSKKVTGHGHLIEDIHFLLRLLFFTLRIKWLNMEYQDKTRNIMEYPVCHSSYNFIFAQKKTDQFSSQ